VQLKAYQLISYATDDSLMYPTTWSLAAAGYDDDDEKYDMKQLGASIDETAVHIQLLVLCNVYIGLYIYIYIYMIDKQQSSSL